MVKSVTMRVVCLNKPEPVEVLGSAEEGEQAFALRERAVADAGGGGEHFPGAHGHPALFRSDFQPSAQFHHDGGGVVPDKVGAEQALWGAFLVKGECHSCP